ncbi:MAG: ParB/RepB/Spo0J family partition protein [Anaerolineaceae bacterium]|nr:ParB/RepB/Spo0J family partition protein [Anaerolineaceae bacterium]
MAHRGLGRGLDALIPGGFQPKSSQGTQQVPITAIEANPFQPRGEINTVGLEELAKSILEHGIIQPLILSKSSTDGQYTLIAGERRLRAAEIAGLKSVPAIIRDVTEQERLEIAIIENIQREDLTPLESALAYQQLIDEFNLSHEDISIKVGKSRATITNTLRLLKLPDDIQIALHSLKISEGHARALLGLPSKKSQIAALQTILIKGLNVRQTEDLVRKFSGQKQKTEKGVKEISPEVKSIEDQLRTLLGTKVTLHNGKRGGTLVIHYYSEEELETLINRFKKL